MTHPRREPFTEADERAVRATNWDGLPGECARWPTDVPVDSQTSSKPAPCLPDGTPFPTIFYLTCPRASAECSRLESAGVMAEMTARLAEDKDFAARYVAAHEDYLARREAIAVVECLRGISAGGMPDRVKCLHAHLGHTLAAGPGINPVGDEVLARIGPWWQSGSCGSQDGACS